MATIPVWIGLYQALSNVANEVRHYELQISSKMNVLGMFYIENKLLLIIATQSEGAAD